MADQPYKEGDVVSNDQGDQLTLKGGQWLPTVATDVKKDIPSALVRTGIGMATVPETMAGMAGNLTNYVGNKVAPDTWQNDYGGTVRSAVSSAINPVGNLVHQGAQALSDALPASEQDSTLGKTVSGVAGFSQPLTYEEGVKKYEDKFGQLYQPQRNVTKIGEAALQAAPMGLLAPEAAVPNVVRSLLSGAASEGAGQLLEGSPYEQMARIVTGLGTYGMLSMSPAAAVRATSPRSAWAQTMEQGGARPSASDITGSRWSATLEGEPLPKQAGEVNQGMLNLSNTPRAGGTASVADDLATQKATLKTTGDQLAANTSIPPPLVPPLRTQLQGVVSQHAHDFAGAEKPEVAQALDRFDTHLTENAVQGRPGLTGKQYQRLHEEWGASDVPEVRQMSGLVDAAMDKAHPNAWEGWRQNFADNKGLLAQNVKQGEGTLTPFDPAKVAGAMYKETPMNKFANASAAIMNNRPQPYAPNLAELLGASGASGILGTAVGHALNVGTDPGIEGFLVGGALPGTLSLAGRATQPFFRSPAGQNMLRNFDPKVVTALLAQQGIKPKGEQPNPSK